MSDKSIYEMWLEVGYKGSVEDFFKSLDGYLFDVGDIVICTDERFDEGFYFMAGPEFGDKCKISIFEPKYIKTKDEAVILSESQIEEMIQKFNEPSKCFDGSNWQYLLKHFGSKVSLDLSMPDYRLLNKK